MSLDVQFMTLAMMVISGIGMGAVFDGYRVVSHELRIGRLWIPILDLLYWAAATLTVFGVLTSVNEGEVRAYVFIGLLIGIAFYFWLLSRPFIRLVRWLANAVRALIRLAIRLFDLAVVKPGVMLYRLIRVILGFGTVFTMFLFRIVIQLLRPFWLLLSWMFGPLVRPLWRRVRGWPAALGLATALAWLKDVIGRIRRKWF